MVENWIVQKHFRTFFVVRENLFLKPWLSTLFQARNLTSFDSGCFYISKNNSLILGPILAAVISSTKKIHSLLFSLFWRLKIFAKPFLRSNVSSRPRRIFQIKILISWCKNFFSASFNQNFGLKKLGIWTTITIFWIKTNMGNCFIWITNQIPYLWSNSDQIFKYLR